jgi:hypothetical protein
LFGQIFQKGYNKKTELGKEDVFMTRVMDVEAPAVLRTDRQQLQAQVAEQMSAIPDNNSINSDLFLSDLAELIAHHLIKHWEPYRIPEERDCDPIDILDV